MDLYSYHFIVVSAFV